MLCVLKDEVFNIHDNIALKIYMALHANFHLASDPSFVTEPATVLRLETLEVYESSDFDDILGNMYEAFVNSIKNFQMTGSDFVLQKLLEIDLHILEFYPLRGTFNIYHHQKNYSIKKLQIKKYEKCFLWAVLSCLHHAELNAKCEEGYVYSLKVLREKKARF